MKLSRKKITKLLKGNHQTRKRYNKKKKPSKKRQRSTKAKLARWRQIEARSLQMAERANSWKGCRSAKTGSH